MSHSKNYNNNKNNVQSKSNLVEDLNEMLSVENASIDRIISRIDQTSARTKSKTKVTFRRNRRMSKSWLRYIKIVDHLPHDNPCVCVFGYCLKSVYKCLPASIYILDSISTTYIDLAKYRSRTLNVWIVSICI